MNTKLFQQCLQYIVCIRFVWSVHTEQNRFFQVFSVKQAILVPIFATMVMLRFLIILAVICVCVCIYVVLLHRLFCCRYNDTDGVLKLLFDAVYLSSRLSDYSLQVCCKC